MKKWMVLPVALAATMPLIGYLLSSMNQPSWLAFVGAWVGVVGLVAAWIALVKWVFGKPKEIAEKKNNRRK